MVAIRYVATAIRGLLTPGALVQKYRKAHLFDLCLPKMTYRESDTFSAGNKLATFDTPFGRFGLAICYDLRFAEIAMLAARQGCVGVFYPAAFNTHTGPLHWELLQRARALDNQIYIATCSCARDETAKYVIVSQLSGQQLTTVRAFDGC